MQELMIAWMLITTPEMNDLKPYNTPEMRQAIVEVAIEQQLMDEQEKRYKFASIYHYKSSSDQIFQAELETLRERYKECKDAPRMEELSRFPDRVTVDRLIDFSNAHINHLEKELIFTDRMYYTKELIREARKLNNAWVLLSKSQTKHYYIVSKREALRDLRDLIGKENFDAGLMPDYVPTWRFREWEK